jgi:hypothetical protein
MSKTMRTAALMIAVVLVVAGAVGASATDERAGTRRLTGCRNLTTGTLDQVTRGLQPLGGVCGAGERRVSWKVTGETGPQGPAGATGATGATGTPGVSGWETVSSTSASDSSNPKQVIAYCPAGKKVVGGGGNASGGYAFLFVSEPITPGVGWGVVAGESPPTDQNWSLTAYAICVTALP